MEPFPPPPLPKGKHTYSSVPATVSKEEQLLGIKSHLTDSKGILDQRRWLKLYGLWMKSLNLTMQMNTLKKYTLV